MDTRDNPREIREGGTENWRELTSSTGKNLATDHNFYSFLRVSSPISNRLLHL